MIQIGLKQLIIFVLLMTNVDILYKTIEQGREGKNKGFSTGIQKLDEYTGGVRSGIYTLIFGLSGSGKTALALYSYIYRPLKDNPDANIVIVYYSLEMSAPILLSKLLCMYIYEEFGKIIPYTTLMSWQDKLSDESYTYVQKGKEWLKSIEKKFIIFDKSLNNKSFYHSLMTLLENWGTFTPVNDGKQTIYIKNDPDQVVQVIIDHIGLCQAVDGHSKKEEIDLISSYCVSIREKCRVSFTILQQENRNSSDIDRVKAGMTECSPDGLKDSGGPYNDCEVCIGVYYPLKFKLKSYQGYPVIIEDTGQQNPFLGLRDRIRVLCLIKNRQGISDRVIPVNFFGELGVFRQLPSSKQITDWRPYLNLNNLSISQNINKIEDSVQKEPQKELNYHF